MGTAAVNTAGTTATNALRGTRGAERFAWVTLAYFILVVLWGAIVRATDSGGGCGANWPLCNGDFFPHHPRLATMIEFAHRSSSGMCAVMTIALGLWTFWRTPVGHAARKAVSWSGFFLVLEALLGAALVLKHWVEGNVSTGRTIAQSIHFTNTLLLMGALTLTAWFLRENQAEPGGGPKVAAWGAVAATILAGASGSLAALADTLFPSATLMAALKADMAAGAPVLIRMRWLHPAAAIVSAVCVVWLLRALPWRSGTRAVAASLLAQFVLGSLDVVLLAPTWLQVLHLLGANLYWVALVVVAAPVIWTGNSTATTEMA